MFSCEFCRILKTFFTEHLQRLLLSRDWNITFEQAFTDDAPNALKLNQHYNLSHIVSIAKLWNPFKKKPVVRSMLTPSDDTLANILPYTSPQFRNIKKALILKAKASSIVLNM